MPGVRLIETDLPIFGEPTMQPEITGAGMDALVVYGDREHSANIAYLTGYDPRFEGALLVRDVTRATVRVCTRLRTTTKLDHGLIAQGQRPGLAFVHRSIRRLVGIS